MPSAHRPHILHPRLNPHPWLLFDDVTLPEEASGRVAASSWLLSEFFVWLEISAEHTCGISKYISLNIEWSITHQPERSSSRFW